MKCSTVLIVMLISTLEAAAQTPSAVEQGLFPLPPAQTRNSAKNPTSSVDVVRPPSGKLTGAYAAHEACIKDACGELVYNRETKDVVSFRGKLTARYQLTADGSIVRKPRDARLPSAKWPPDKRLGGALPR